MYRTLARSILRHGNEAWTITKQDVNRTTTYEVKFMRKTVGYTKWDYKKFGDLR